MIREVILILIVVCMIFTLAACSASPDGMATDKFKQEHSDLKVVKVQPIYAQTTLLNNDISESCTVNIYYNDKDFESYVYQKTNGQWAFVTSASSTD